jgi:spoIIIJ-associated protein
MSDEVTIEAASQQAALQQAAELLGVASIEDVAWSYDRDHFRTGARTVKIHARRRARVAAQAPARGQESAPVSDELREAASKAKGWVIDLLEQFGCQDAEVQVRTREESVVVMVRSGEDGALLIGKEGRNIEALQVIFDRAAERMGIDARVVLDIGDYRSRRDDHLRAEAQKIAEGVKRTGRAERMRPLNSYERHLVHTAVKEVGGVGSRSHGDGGLKQVEIFPQS